MTIMRHKAHYHMPIPVQCAAAFGASAVGAGAAVIGYNVAGEVFDVIRPVYNFPAVTKSIIGLGFFVTASAEACDHIAWRMGQFCRIKHVPR